MAVLLLPRRRATLCQSLTVATRPLSIFPQCLRLLPPRPRPQEWEEIKHKTLVAADKATDAAARSALISFFAILLGAVLCCVAGAYGGRKTQERVDI